MRNKKTFYLNTFESDKRSFEFIYLFIGVREIILQSQKWLTENLFCLIGKVLRNPMAFENTFAVT